MGGDDLLGGSEAVNSWHTDVHQDHLRLGGCDHRQGCCAVSCFADDLDVALGVEDHPEPGPHQFLVISQDDADHSAAPIGIRALIR